MEELETSQVLQAEMINKLGDRLDSVDRKGGRLDILEEKEGDLAPNRVFKDPLYRFDRPAKNQGGQFLDLSDPLGLRKLGGLTPRVGYQSRWIWVPVRLVLLPYFCLS